MARPLRIEYPGAVYHVTSRGNARNNIYENDQDRKAFLNLLSEVVKKCNWHCHAYCLMDNHYHLLIETPDANLSYGMRQLNGIYTQRYNKRHQTVGHIFQGRFKSILVDKINGKSPMDDLQEQIIIGNKVFVEKIQEMIKVKEAIAEIPRNQRFVGRQSLEDLFYDSAELTKELRNQKISKAHLEYGYTLKEIADSIGIHYTTVSKILREREK
jgi:REP element-mobilizing transposase RayT